MPKKGYKQSEEHKRRVAEKSTFQKGHKINLGLKRSEEVNKKNSEAHKGLLAWNKGLTKEDPRIKQIVDKLVGRITSEETKLKQRESHKGYVPSEETTKKIRDSPESQRTRFKKGNVAWNKGKKFLEESIKKMSESHKGKQCGENNPFYGKHHTEETKRKSSELHKGRYDLEKNPAWLGGKSFEPYSKEFNNKFKKFIRGRDGGCILCNLGFEELKLLKRRTHTHHIDYNKLNSLPQNCICLCNPCHSKTNSNRSHWKKFFQSLLAERYGYEYDENQNIILKLNNQLNFTGG